jgi:hypothetical protein
MSGFVNIKSAFLDKYPESSPASELRISFIGVGDILSVRDARHPERAMVLAILNYGPSVEVKYNLNQSSAGFRLIKSAISYFAGQTTNSLANYLNEQFELCGTYSSRK